jgi:hypothetical protein
MIQGLYCNFLTSKTKVELYVYIQGPKYVYTLKSYRQKATTHHIFQSTFHLTGVYKTP